MEHNHDCSHSHEHGHEHEDAHDKYMEALAKYNTHLNDEDVKAKVTHFIEEHWLKTIHRKLRNSSSTALISPH